MEEKISKYLKNYLEQELRDYDKNKKYLEELRMDIIDSSPSPELGMPGNPNRGNEGQTEKVFKLISNNRINRLERIINAIHKTLEGLNEEQYKFYIRYFQKGQSRTKVCIELPIGEATFHRYKNRIIYALAKELGYL